MSDAKEPEKKEEGAAAATPAKGVSPGMFFGMIGGLLLLMVGSMFAFFKYGILPQIETIKKNSDPMQVIAEGGGQEAPKEEGGHGGKKAEGGHGDKKEKSGSGGSNAEVFEISEVTVNVAGTRAGRILKVTLNFDASDTVYKELNQNSAQIQDLVIQILARKTMEDLTAPTALGMLRTELITNVNALLKEGKVSGINFKQFIIQ